MDNSTRIKDLVNIREKEVQWAVLFTIALLVLLTHIGFYGNFEMYIQGIGNIFVCLLGALIGMLGFSLSGIALVAGLFPTSVAQKIEKDSGKENVGFLLSSYTFLSKNIGIQCVALIVEYIAMLSERPKIVPQIFWMIVSLEIYHIFFIIFYTVSLVSNCAQLYEIKNIYERISDDKCLIKEKARDVQMDFVISTLSNITKETPKEAVKHLYEFVGETDLEDKDAILEYLKRYYGD